MSTPRVRLLGWSSSPLACSRFGAGSRVARVGIVGRHHATRATTRSPKLALALALAFLWPSPIVAAAPPEGTTPAPNVDAAAERREAGRAFRRGVEAYGANDFATAVREFEAANALVPHPDTIYNLALAVQATGDTRRAYALFSTVERTAADPELVREARRALQELRASLGVLTVHTAPGSIVCVDAQLVPPHGSGLHEVALAPGAHSIAVHDVDLQVELRAGEARTLWLDRVDAVTARRQRRTSRALTGAAIGFATLASGLAVGAVAAEDGPRAGLEVGAAVSGGLSVGTLIALLAHERAHTKGHTKARVSATLLEQPRCSPATH